MKHIKTTEINLAPDKKIILETGRLANEANASVLVTCGETMILVTCCVAKQARPDIDFFPLTVDFEEKLYAVGRIPGSYNRREGRPNDKAILAGRLIDRPLRPLFPDGFRNDVNIVATIISADQEHPTDVLAVLGASVAVSLSGAPFLGPVGAVRVALVKGQFIVNPTYAEQTDSMLDLIVAGTEKSFLMIEAGADFVKEETLLAGIAFAQEHIKQQVSSQKEFFAQHEIKHISFEPPVVDEGISSFVSEVCSEKLNQVIQAAHTDKREREAQTDLVQAALIESLAALEDENPLKSQGSKAKACFRKLEKKLMRDQILHSGVRIDGRKCNEVRQISSEVGLVKRGHGSGLFNRGSTQVLSTITLGTVSDSKPIDGTWPEREQAFYHNYNFPAYSVGEARGMRPPGRREVGHGALAERALIPSLPPKDIFPYTIRVVSDVLGSNGSTSMASTCASSLALMDGGVPVKELISGIAMGLILEGGQCAILTDIQGVEDFLGDMDFKVAGGRDGITAIQLDLKLPQGISMQVLKLALDHSLVGRQFILDKMYETISAPRESISPHAPSLLTINISVEDIGGIIGPSGKNIKKLIEETGVEKIDIDQTGLVMISGRAGSAELAREKIKQLTLRLEPGCEYLGTVCRRLDFGLLVEFGPGKVGLVRSSAREPRRSGPPGRSGGNSRYGSRDRQSGSAVEENSAPASTEISPEITELLNSFEIGDLVLGLVKEIDPKGRINLESIRRPDQD